MTTLSSPTPPQEAFDPTGTALLIIDLQMRIVGQRAEPHTGADVVRQSMRLADAFREAGGQVVIVKVEWPRETQPPGSELVQEMTPGPGDLLIAKRGWSAFHDTGLHATLGERGLDTLVLTGISTNHAVESTARTARDHGYRMLLPHDAMAGRSAVAHRFAIEEIFPLLGTVCTTDDVLGSLNHRHG